MTERYGNRKVSKMYKEVQEHRQAVARGDFERIQETWDKIENWIDYCFGQSSEQKSVDP